MSASDGHIIGSTKIVDHGPDNVRWNLVIVGDGYRATEIGQYHTDVETFLGALRTTPPYTELYCGINVHRIDVVSTDSGADDNGCDGVTAPFTAATYFDARYCTPFAGVPMDRLLTVDSGLALSVASTYVPLRHQVLCIVNSAKYGGSGGAIATCSTNVQAREIAIHEIGHSAYGLADEYGGDGTATPAGEFPEPNVTRDTNRATNKWRAYIDAATPMPSQCNGACAASTCVAPGAPPAPGAVGTYEGGQYSDCNTYRPLPSCYMRDYGPFCPVCAGVIRATLQPFLPPESIALNTPSIEFRDVPAGMGGVGVTTHRAIVFEVVTCRSLTFTIINGPTGGFVALNTSVTATADPILPAMFARIWLAYTSTNPGDTASGSVRVRCNGTGDEFLININANTIARPRAAVALVMDRSGSMADDAGDATTKVQKLREAANVFVSIMQPDDGIGLVRFDDTVQRLMDVTDGGGAAALTHIMSSELDPAGATSIGGGVVEGRDTLNDAVAAATVPYDVTALVVLTDGLWNTPPSLASVTGSITANTYAVGIGLPSGISVPALTTLCQGHDGYLLITGAISTDQSMRMAKYMLQILAGVTNAEVAADPRGALDVGAEHRIPFWITEADYGMDLIVLSPGPQFIDFQLEAPDGTRITPASGPGGANAQYVLSRYAAYYRCALPVLPADARGSHAGLWHAVLKLGKYGKGRGGQYMVGPTYYAASFDPKLKVLPYEFVAHTYSSLSFRAQLVQSSYEPGAQAKLIASLTEYDVPMSSRADVWAEIGRPDGATDHVTLRLDGRQQYTTTYELRQPGVYAARIRARGTASDGSRFERERTLTAVAAIGGDRWDPNDPKTNDLCGILHCLKESGALNADLARKLKEFGIDLDALLKCLGSRCSGSGTKEGTKAVRYGSKAKVPFERMTHQQLIDALNDLLRKS
jgi:hypothetical protein